MPAIPKARGHPGHAPCLVAGLGLQDAASIPAPDDTRERHKEKEFATFNS